MRKSIAMLASLFVLHNVTGCGKHEKPLPSVRESGEIVVLTVKSPTTYYEDASAQPTGLEYDLASAFAQDSGLKLRFRVLASEAELIPALEARRGHMAAGGLVPTPARDDHVRFGPAYQSIRPQVVYRTKHAKPTGVKDLVGLHLGVLTGSHHAERLAELRKQYPGLSWSEFDAESPDDLLRRVSEGSLDAAIVDSDSIQLSRYFYPDVDVAFDLNGPEGLAWAFPFAGDDYVYKAANKFFARIQKDGTLKRLIERYYGNASQLARVDANAFLEKVQTVLPRYRRFFQDAQEVTGIDWRLIAAVGYQESHWDPSATSPTGVRGLMMLTEETADRMGIKNRLDPRENIVAGAQYLVTLKDGLPARIAEPDRTWLAVAAYNQGLGHLEDARILAQRQKLSPDSWQDVKAVLPLLASPEHYATLKLGYARGGEALAMTESVRSYYDILARLEKAHRPLFETSSGTGTESTMIAAEGGR